MTAGNDIKDTRQPILNHGVPQKDHLAITTLQYSSCYMMGIEAHRSACYNWSLGNYSRTVDIDETIHKITEIIFIQSYISI